MKAKIIKNITLSAGLATGLIGLIPATSCGCSKSLEDQLKSMPNVAKVEKLNDLAGFESRYMIWFKHPIDWNDQSKGYFNQRVELNFRGYDRINQLFTCGYEVRNFKPDRMNDFEIANRYLGNIIKPEYRFYDQSRPEGLDNKKLAGWEYLNNSQAMKDFHSIIESFKTIFKNKWVFTGTSKGGETTNCFAMTYPNDCDVYVPYVAPRFYDRGNKTLTNWVYTTIGEDVLGKTAADDYKLEIARLQWFALKNKKKAITSDSDTMIERVWESGKVWKEGVDYEYTEYANKHHDYMYFLCVTEFATAFWQYKQDVAQLKEFNSMPEDTQQHTKDKLIKCAQLLSDVAGITGYAINGLFFPYESQACREMGEYCYDGEAMISFIQRMLPVLTTDEIRAEIPVPADQLKDNAYYWQLNLTQEQYQAWVVNGQQDMTLANKMKDWNDTCTVPVIMVFGGADPWTALRLDDNGKSKTIKRYIGKDPVNAYGRTHVTRISTLSNSQQNEVWAQLDELLK